MSELEINAIILIIVIIQATGLLVYKYYESRIKGAKGEYIVEKLLRKLNKKEYKIFNNLYLKIEDRTTQIDHLIISIYGIYVIETKNYQGWIHGSENSDYWTQSIYKEKIKFRNPIKQNWSHIYFLKNILQNFKYIKYHSIIVFAGNAKLKNIHSKIPVIYKQKLLKTIKNNKNFNLSAVQIAEISNQISAFMISEKKIRRKHRKYVKHSVQRRNKNIKSLICPNCNGILKVRRGKYGKFYGCSNYPKCKYSNNI